MNQGEVILAVSWLAGYVVQWLRGLPWFNDGATVVVWAAGGALAAFIGSDHLTLRPFLFSALQDASAIAGGTAVGHVLSRVSTLAPRFNQFAPPAAPAAKP